MDRERLDWSKVRERQRQYRRARLKWVRRHSAEARVLELTVAIGTGIACGIAGVIVGKIAGNNLWWAGAAGVGGALLGGVGGYVAVVMLFYWLAPAQMAHKAKQASHAKAKRLAGRFDEKYGEMKQERDVALKTVALLSDARRDKIAHLRAIRTSVEHFFDGRDCTGPRAKSCAIGLGKYLIRAVEHRLYEAPEFSDERYAMTGYENDPEGLFVHVLSVMKHTRTLAKKSLVNGDSVIQFHKYLLEDIDRSIAVEGALLGD